MTSHLAPLEYLERFVGGRRLDGDDARGFLRSWVAGGASDAQMAAWMADVGHAGLSDAGVYALASELIGSGDRLELDTIGLTGAIVGAGCLGDATVLVAAPLAACLGVKVLGDAEHAIGVIGGTAELLDAIPGYHGPSDVGQAVGIMQSAGCCISRHLDRLAPAERRLAALRDQTARGNSVELIGASVIARALVLGTTVVVLHLPYGPGALCPDEQGMVRIRELTAAMARAWDRTVHVVAHPIDGMLSPVLGHAALVREAGKVLRGGGDPGLRDAAIQLAASLVSDAVPHDDAPALRAANALEDGSALAAAERWCEAHGADPGVWGDDAGPPLGPRTREIIAPEPLDVAVKDPDGLAHAVRRLGAGRLHASQTIDHQAAVVFHVAPGTHAATGDVVATIHGRDDWTIERAHREIAAALGIADA